MRWMYLFADLEAQAAAAAKAERDGEVAERVRIETGRITLLARLTGAVGHAISLRCIGLGHCNGRLDQVGRDWLLITEPSGLETLVPMWSLLGVGGLGRHSTEVETSPVELGLRSALRGVVRDRSPVRLVLTDGTPVDGTLDRVGADYVEIAEHPLGEPRRPGVIRGVRTVPLAGVAALRRW
ncbi:MAG TPA: hypothetical protein VGP36_19325 [Mycobacteriales bacterium]|jgi:hypothetical protein|nr:hypothetical protein [Mycobacteriales bacterium]